MNPMFLISVLLVVASKSVSGIKVVVSCPSASAALKDEFVSSVSKFGSQIDAVLECGVESRRGFMRSEEAETIAFENCITALNLPIYWEAAVSKLDLDLVRSDFKLKRYVSDMMESFCWAVKRTHNYTDSVKDAIYPASVELEFKSISASEVFSDNTPSIFMGIVLVIVLISGVVIAFVIVKKRKSNKCCKCRKDPIEESPINLEVIIPFSEKPPAYN